MVTNGLEIFENVEFGEVRVVFIDDEPYFVAKDIALALGYKDPKNTVKNRCKKGRVSEIPHPQNHNKRIEITVIPESDIYRLIIGSKLKSAQKFESWIMDEVLPSIRKHGAYMTEQTIEKALTSPDFLIKLATQLKLEQEARKLAEQKIEEQQPKVEYHDTVLNKDGLITTTVIAKDLGFKSAAKLNQIMNLNGIIFKNKSGTWCPYAEYEWLITNGYADYKSYEAEKAKPCLKWTEKGRKWIVDNYNGWVMKLVG